MDTIAAIATPSGSGGIGIIKISGPRTRSVMEKLFRRSGRAAEEMLPPRQLCHGHIREPESGRIIDEVMAVLMPGPASYTREDVAEIQAHAGAAVLAAILDLILAQGVRLAEPGEFTRRAFMSGRIDLTQAEGIIDVINAGSERALAAAAVQMGGAIRDRMDVLRAQLREILGTLEAAIDFPEDIAEDDQDDGVDAEAAGGGGLISHLEDIRESLGGMAERGRESRWVREGLRVVVAGRPNVGKSSLMNGLLRQERAIVTPIPGTTRDAIDAPLTIAGVSLSLTDTAGLHESQDPVERIGIERTRERIAEADLLLFVLDAAEGWTPEDQAILDEIGERPKIIVLNKWDRVSEDRADKVNFGKENIITTSALYGDGIDHLRESIGRWIQKRLPSETENPILPNLRHGALLASARDSVDSAITALTDGLPPDLLAIDIREAIRTVGKITGEHAEPDLLDEIFSRFCIGK